MTVRASERTLTVKVDVRHPTGLLEYTVTSHGVTLFERVSWPTVALLLMNPFDEEERAA